MDNKESEDEDNENIENGLCHRKRVLISTEAAELLETAGKGSLGILINREVKHLLSDKILQCIFFRYSIEKVCFREKGITR